MIDKASVYQDRKLEDQGLLITSTEKEELALIFRSLHTEEKDEFRNAVRQLMTQEEWASVLDAEKENHLSQTLSIFDSFVKQRLPLRFAEIVGWRTPSGVAQVVEPAENLEPKLRIVTLKLSRSRHLNGPVAFRVVRDLTRVKKTLPKQVFRCLEEAIESDYFKQIVYLEPMLQKNRILRSQKSVKRFHHPRPVDPILAGFLGGGPPAYGYNYHDPYVREQLRNHYCENYLPFTAFLIAHWD